MADDTTSSRDESDVASAEAADVLALKAELERLEAENRSLRESTDVEPGASKRARNRWGIALAIVAALLFTVAVPAVWVNRVVMDTDAWVATVAPLASDPAIQDAVAKGASTALIERLDAQKRLESVLPTAFAPIAPVIASSVNGFVRDQATAVVRSDEFSTLWTELNRSGHELIIGSLTGQRDGAVQVEAGTITLDVGMVADKIQERLVDSGLTFLENVPLTRLDRTVTLYQSSALANAAVAIDAMNKAALAIPLVALAMLAAAFGVAADRRKIALYVGGGIVLAGFVPLQALYLSQYYVVNSITALGSLPADAAQSAYQIIFSSLFAAEQTLAVLGLIIWVAAIVAGPARWATALRGGLSGGIAGVASHLELGRFGAWVARRKSGLRTGGFVGAVLLLLALPAPRTITGVLWVVFAVIVWLLLVELLGATPAPEDGAPDVTSEIEPGDGTQPPVTM